MGIDKFEGLLPDWQTKTTYYNHIPKFNNEGDLAKQRRGAKGFFPIEFNGKCNYEAQGKECVCNSTKNSKKTEVTPKENPVVKEITMVDTEE